MYLNIGEGSKILITDISDTEIRGFIKYEQDEDLWCGDCPLCSEYGEAHLKGHSLICQCDTCIAEWYPQKPFTEFNRQMSRLWYGK